MERKNEKYLKTSIEIAISKVKDHYIMNNNIKIQTTPIFEKAVDPILYPQYSTIIKNPMDLAKMNKNLNSGRYTGEWSQGIVAVLRDVDLIRDNAHTFNPGQENLVIRQMADALRNYFRYILKICLKVFFHFSDEATKTMVFSPEIEEFLNESDTEDVRTFLNLSNIDVINKYLDNGGLLRQLNIKSVTPEFRPILQDLVRVKLDDDLLYEPEDTSLSAKKSSKAKTAGVKRSSSVAELEDESVVKAPKSKASGGAGRVSIGNDKKRKKLISDDTYDTYGSVYMDDEEAVIFDDPYAPVAPLVALAPVNRPDWYEAADNVLKKLSKHAFVDQTKNTVAADFFNIIHSIGNSEDYRKVIAKPMDLMLIRDRLETNAILDAQEFYEMLLLVFQNAVNYNAPHAETSFFVKMLVEKCRYLVNYSKWLCLEHFQLVDDTKDQNPTQFGDLRVTLRDQARIEREAILNSAAFSDFSNNPYTECRKLIKDFERANKKNEQLQISYFIVPVDIVKVSDYSAYVRDPVDLSTIKYRLEGTEPSNPEIAEKIDRKLSRYVTFGEFMKDFRRIFKNAITYNQVYLETDTTGITKAVYEAAVALQEKFENLLPKFTLSVVDRLECSRLLMKEQYQVEEERRNRKMKEDEEMRRKHMEMIETIKKVDPKFAADLDVEAKRKQTESYQRNHLAQQQREVVQSNIITKLNDEQLIEDLSSPDQSPGLSPELPGALPLVITEVKAPNTSLVFGFGRAGEIPSRFADLADSKAILRTEAWNFFLNFGGSR